jgi:hypothetical protein
MMKKIINSFFGKYFGSYYSKMTSSFITKERKSDSTQKISIKSTKTTALVLIQNHELQSTNSNTVKMVICSKSKRKGQLLLHRIDEKIHIDHGINRNRNRIPSFKNKCFEFIRKELVSNIHYIFLNNEEISHKPNIISSNKMTIITESFQGISYFIKLNRKVDKLIHFLRRQKR